jgi:hypothetical protein
VSPNGLGRGSERKKTEGDSFLGAKTEIEGRLDGKCIGEMTLGMWVVKSIQGKTEFTRSIGFRGSVRSVQSSRVFVRRNSFRSGSFFRAGLSQGSLIGLGPGEKKFEESLSFRRGRGRVRRTHAKGRMSFGASRHRHFTCPKSSNYLCLSLEKQTTPELCSTASVCISRFSPCPIRR